MLENEIVNNTVNDAFFEIVLIFLITFVFGLVIGIFYKKIKNELKKQRENYISDTENFNIPLSIINNETETETEGKILVEKEHKSFNLFYQKINNQIELLKQEVMKIKSDVFLKTKDQESVKNEELNLFFKETENKIELLKQEIIKTQSQVFLKIGEQEGKNNNIKNEFILFFEKLKDKIQSLENNFVEYQEEQEEIQNEKINLLIERKFSILAKNINYQMEAFKQEQEKNNILNNQIKNNELEKIKLNEEIKKQKIINEEQEVKEQEVKEQEVKKEPVVPGTNFTNPFKILKNDDLKIVEGIGPKIEILLKNAGIHTWHDLASVKSDHIRMILKKGGDRFAFHDPSTWPEQASLAVQEKWKELEEFQNFLKGGRVE